MTTTLSDRPARITACLAAAAFALPTVLFHQGCRPRSGGSRPAGPASFLEHCGSDLDCQQRLILSRLLLGPDELGPRYDRAQYGKPNPECWTVRNVPGKFGRGLQRLIRQGADPATRYCYFEYVRKGTHEDIIVDLYILPTEQNARSAIQSRYVSWMNLRLGRAGLPPFRRKGNILFVVVGSISNKGKILEVHKLVGKRLGLF